MLALTRARAQRTAPPAAFVVQAERARTLSPLTDVTPVNIGDDSPTCVALDQSERRYLLIGTISGGCVVADTEANAEAPVVVCRISGRGARVRAGERGDGNQSAASGTASGTASEAPGHAYATSCASWLPSDTGGFYTGGFDHAVKFWDANAAEVASEIDVGAKVRAVAPSGAAGSGALCAIGSDDDVVRLWDPASNAIAHTLSGHRGGVSAIDWLRSSEYALATGGAEGDVRVWDIRRAGAYMILDRHNTQPSARVDAIKDAMYAGASVVGGTHEAGPRPASRKMADAVPEHLRADSARRCSSSGWGRSNGASTSGGGGVNRKRARNGGWGGWGVGFRGRGRGDDDERRSSRVFPARDGYSSVSAPAHDGRVSAVKVTPCGMFLISTGADGRIRRWDLSNGLNTYTPYDESGLAPTSVACQIAITADGERLFVPCTDGRVRSYRTHTGTMDAELRAHMDDVFACAYKDGGDAELFTCGKDANVLVWRPAKGSIDNVAVDGDDWSDDDDVIDRRLLDPSSTHRGGLGYRSIRRPVR